MSNNSNFNYLETIPTQQYQLTQPTQQQYQLQQAQVMGPNGQLINIPELDQSIARFEQIKPQTEFREIRTQLPIVLANYYKKYFAYLETIKQRRGQDEYLSGLRKILNKMNEYVSKTEKTIINLKKTLDYTESTLPIQQQYSINGIPQTQNTFIIPELQNVVEKDNNIEFVDIFGLKKQNIAHISPEYRNLILLVVQSFMGFPPIIPEPKLNICLKILDETIKGIEKDNFLTTDKGLFDTIEGNPAFQPLVKVDIYSKLFSIFESGNLNIKDIKTDKIDDKIVETTPNKSSSSSSYSSSPYSSSYGYSSYNSYGGSPYQSFGSNQKRNFQQLQQGKPQQSSQPQGKSNKIKKILKYEIPVTNTTGNTEYELQSLLKKKGIELTNYSFLNEEMIEELRKISPKQNTNSSNLKNQQSQQNSINLTTTTGGGPSVKKTGQQSNTKPKELTGYQIIKLIKDDKQLKDKLKTGKIDDFVTKLEDSFKTKQKKHTTVLSYYERTEKERLRDEKLSKIKDLKDKKNKESNNNIKRELQKEFDKTQKELQIINNLLGSQTNLRYTKAQIQKVVQELNLFLKDIIERKYPKRILKCGEESFGTMTRTVLDFFTNMTDKITIKNEGTYDKLKKNDESKSIYFIQMYSMMYETYLDYYRTYTIEKISKSFTKNTLASDNQLKLRILNGLGVYSVIIYRKLKEVLDKIKEKLLMVSPDFGKAMDMLSKVQTLLNSSANEAKKEKLLKIKKDILNEIAKLTNNKKTNQRQNGRDKFGNGRDKFGNGRDKFDKFGNGRDKFDKFDKFGNGRDKFGEKKKFERYKKQENNNVSL